MKDILQFEPWPSCTISSLFWKTLAAKKLNEFLKGRIDIKINGFYLKKNKNTKTTTTSALFLTTESFETEKIISSVAELGTDYIKIPGKLVLCDTIEEFKALDRAAEALKVVKDNYTCSNLESDIEYFVIFAFADVKKFKFYHQIAYPIHIFSNEQITYELTEERKSTEISDQDLNSPFDINLNSKVIQFYDNSCKRNVPGWPLRQLLVILSYKFPGSVYKIYCKRSENDSFSMTVKLPNTFSTASGLTGWERSSVDSSKIAPIRVTDISGLLDPVQLAKQAGELNLKLMKWRLVPDLDLDCLNRTSCLLIGSGTLGCNILRLLLGWGFRKITLIDNGKVSYSNPVRQSLFTFEDAKAGASKALTAASRALQIDPNAQVEGFDISVPMPGHFIFKDSEIESKNSYNTLNHLVKSHDVIFLLTDSRESRWLPALLGHQYEKIVITVGLGFDSYVVMRHGMRYSIDKSSCYFCHDIIGPTDSLTGRSLDQQCTVTRPGLSFIAAALAVELLVSLLQVKESSKVIPANAQSLLGKIPHQIRGNLANQEMFTLIGTAFEHCTCCSESILKEFENGDEFEFIKNVCNSPMELERISGLTEMKAALSLEVNENDDEQFAVSENDF